MLFADNFLYIEEDNPSIINPLRKKLKTETWQA
jgi:hypothetical protein